MVIQEACIVFAERGAECRCAPDDCCLDLFCVHLRLHPLLSGSDLPGRLRDRFDDYVCIIRCDSRQQNCFIGCDRVIALVESLAYICRQIDGRPGATPELVKPTAREAKALLCCQVMRADMLEGYPAKSDRPTDGTEALGGAFPASWI